MSSHSPDKLASLKRLVRKLRDKTLKYQDEYPEKSVRGNHNGQYGTYVVPNRRDINIQDPRQFYHGGQAEDISHIKPQNTDPTANPSSPGRVDSGVSAGRDQLRDEAQHRNSPSHPPPIRRRSTRSKTWDSVKSVGASSVRSVASLAQNLKEFVCWPRLTQSAPHIACSSEKKPARAGTDLGLQSHTIVEEDTFGTPTEVFNAALPKTALTFPIEKRRMPTARELLEAKLRERRQTSEDFNQIWEDEALPRLRKTMNESHVTDYSISIQADYGEPFIIRIVEVMTTIELSPETDQELRDGVLKPFLAKPSLKVKVSITVGNIDRSLATDAQDVYDQPSNPLSHEQLLIGDSVGYKGGDSAATIGPAVRWNDTLGALVNFHLFHGAPKLNQTTDGLKSNCEVVHPAEMDCSGGIEPRDIATLFAHSGFPMYRTQRSSNSIKTFCPKLPQNEARVETDWAFVVLKGDGKSLQNRIRYAPEGREFQPFSGLITGSYPDNPRMQLVRCTGRTSGMRYAVVCETPAEVRQGREPTREWYLENIVGVPGMPTTAAWNAGGCGIPGDSGAAVVHDDTRQLIGQVWGRNVYGGDSKVARIAYFTHITDIFDDLVQRYPQYGQPTLGGQGDSDVAASDRPFNNMRDNIPRVTFNAELEVNGAPPRRSRAQWSVPIWKHSTRPISSHSVSHSISGSSATTVTEPTNSFLEVDATGKETLDVLQIVVSSRSSVSVGSSDS